MPKPYTFPTLYNETLQISITKLKEWGYIKPNQFKSGTITWSQDGYQTGRISIIVNTCSNSPYIELNYTYQDEPRNYRVYLITVASNLNKGVIWYFRCPKTNKYCRKLYSIGGYFLHREAFKGCMYESQIQSKKYRALDKTFGAYFKIDQLYQQLHQKHFKSTYAGKPTKKFIAIAEAITKLKQTNVQSLI